MAWGKNVDGLPLRLPLCGPARLLCDGDAFAGRSAHRATRLILASEGTATVCRSGGQRGNGAVNGVALGPQLRDDLVDFHRRMVPAA